MMSGGLSESRPQTVWTLRRPPGGRDVEMQKPPSPGALAEGLCQKLYGVPSPPDDSQLLHLLPHFSLLKDAEKAAERVVGALNSQEPIVIFGDYDVDGTTSCALLKRFFCDLGHDCDIYIPERLVEGYGLNPIGLHKIAQKYPDGVLIITVDNGITAVEACRMAPGLNQEVIITDHHDLGPSIPEAFAVVNPKQQDCLFPYKMLAGAGVAFYVMLAIRARLKELNHPKAHQVNLRSYLDLVALGTIADVAPLDGVNHVLCRTGLRVLDEHLAQHRRPGIRSLLTLTGWTPGTPLTASSVGFQIGPRLNAAGRLGNAEAAAELLFTNNVVLAQELAEHLHEENSARRTLEKTMTAEALELVHQECGSLHHQGVGEAPAFVFAQDHWHTGVVGIVAARVVDKTHRPTLILGKSGDLLKGSGRSIEGFHLFDALSQIRSQFAAFGGHHHAVGLSLSPPLLPSVREHLRGAVLQQFSQELPNKSQGYDGVIDFTFLTEDFVTLFERFEPFGAEHPRPCWRINQVQILSLRVLGAPKESTHARALCVDTTGCEVWLLGFGLRAVFESCLAAQRAVDLLVEARMTTWQMRRRAEFRIVDLK